MALLIATCQSWLCGWLVFPIRDYEIEEDAAAATVEDKIDEKEKVVEAWTVEDLRVIWDFCGFFWTTSCTVFQCGMECWINQGPLMRANSLGLFRRISQKHPEHSKKAPLFC